MAEVIQADLENQEHQQAILKILNAYAQEPFISGQPLPEQVQNDLIAGLQQHPTTHIFLAFKDSQPVGIAVCFLGFSTFAAKPLVNIHDFAVLAEYRGQGVGRQLLDAVEEKARQLNCCKLTLEVNEKNHNARAVYKATGFISTEQEEEFGQVLFLKKTL